jgi:hypothetical protein
LVTGPREQWLSRTQQALKSGGFTKVSTSETLYQVTGSYKKLTTWGEIQVTLAPHGDHTQITARATANVDNIYALFKSPGQTILRQFKNNL